MIIYHGSPQIIETPWLEKGKFYNDYGQGFYCTEHLELAKEWACTENKSGFANVYDLNLDGLKVLRLSESTYCVFHWLALLMEHRKFSMNAPIMKQGANWLREHFLLDISSYDVIIGYRGDDSYFSFAKAFVKNTITVEQLSRAMCLGALGEQVVLKSEKAFGQLEYQKALFADHKIYYPNRKYRDDKARSDYQLLQEKSPLFGVYILDLMRGEVSVDELCL